MQGYYPAEFERELGCLESDWLRWLPGAIGAHPTRLGVQKAVVQLDAGSLHLHWQAAPPRQLAGLSLPRLRVQWRFDAVSSTARQAFMQRFDLYLQRGGG
jgi:hypothetical protein